jgi:Restriction endonuclease EcoRV
MPASEARESTLIHFLREACQQYTFEPVAVLSRTGEMKEWPPTARNNEELLNCLTEGGYLLPLPTESAALANVIEVSLVRYLVARLNKLPGAQAWGGTARAYPDIVVTGDAFGGGHHAVDIKVARRAANNKTTENRISLLTGNTFFLHPYLFAGMNILYDEYKSHLDVLVLYTFEEHSYSHVREPKLVVHETWRLASTKRSSSTREYIGAVTSLKRLERGEGDFSSVEEFYTYWRQADKFKTVNEKTLGQAEQRTRHRSRGLFD